MGRIKGLKLDPDFWRGKKVFVTGHTGFKGTWLSLWLHTLGASVTGYSLDPPTKPSMYEICRMDDIVCSYRNDIRDWEALRDAIRKNQPDIVFHLAAQPLVRESYSAPLDTFSINLMGTVHVLEAVRSALHEGVKIAAVINVTSDKCYDNQEWAWGYRESDRLGGADPYSASKAGSELITDSYRRAFFNSNAQGDPVVPVASARAGNVIGGGDWSKDRLVPDSVRAILAKEPVVIRYPDAVRPWQHVLEPLYGYLLLAQNLVQSGQDYAQGWNFGPDYRHSVNVEQFVSRFCTAWGDGAGFTIENKQDELKEAGQLRLDSSQASRMLEWYPKWNLNTAVAKTVEWYKAYLKQADMRSFSQMQLNAYMTGEASWDDHPDRQSPGDL